MFPNAQFETVIDGLRVHFLHVRGDAGGAGAVRRVPLLLVHGWPGSVVEFTHGFIRALTAPRDAGAAGLIVFDVVAPSIPGYGWSEAPVVRATVPCGPSDA